MIYAVNKRTKEHRILNDARDSNMLHEVIIKADADGWIECDGEHRPIDANQEIQWKGSNGFVSGVIPANCVFWGENGADKITAYRPILNAEETEMKQEWSGVGFPSAGVECEALILADSVHKDWVSGVSEGMLRLPCGRFGCVFKTKTARYMVGAQVEFRPIKTDRERWIEAALKALKPTMGRFAEEESGIVEMIYDAGLAKLPEQTK